MFSYDGIAVLESENDHIPHRSMIHRDTREENCFADMGGIAMQKLKTPHSQALVTIGSVLLSALLQTYVIQTMMQPTGLLSGGVYRSGYSAGPHRRCYRLSFFCFSRNPYAEYPTGTALLSASKQAFHIIFQHPVSFIQYIFTAFSFSAARS